MNITMLMNLTDEELLRMLHEKRAASPVVSELCRRLETALEGGEEVGGPCECPVCLAELSASVNEFGGVELTGVYQ